MKSWFKLASSFKFDLSVSLVLTRSVSIFYGIGDSIEVLWGQLLTRNKVELELGLGRNHFSPNRFRNSSTSSIYFHISTLGPTPVWI
jgi:hypothetical protein